MVYILTIPSVHLMLLEFVWEIFVVLMQQMIDFDNSGGRIGILIAENIE